MGSDGAVGRKSTVLFPALRRQCVEKCVEKAACKKRNSEATSLTVFCPVGPSRLAPDEPRISKTAKELLQMTGEGPPRSRSTVSSRASKRIFICGGGGWEKIAAPLGAARGEAQ